MKNAAGLLILALILSTFSTVPAAAEDRALIIGISQYKDHGIPVIPGVDRDIEMMHEVVETFGFERSQVQILRDAEATRAGIRAAFRDLARTTTPQDRVLYYHSGHGTRVRDRTGDEDDQEDEALLPYDASLNDAGDPYNVLLDDEIGNLLNAIPAREVIVLVDACFSGTVTRGPATGKFFYHPNLREGGRGLLVDPTPSGGGVVLLSAAGAAEEAQATPQGALFTQGVLAAVRRAAPDEHLTLAQLRVQAEAYIAGRLDEPRRRHLLYRPQLDGPPELRHMNLFLNGRPTSPLFQKRREARSRLEALVDAADDVVPVGSSRSVYRPGETLELSVRAPRDGYLHVLNMAEGETDVTVLFPNAYQRNHLVRMGDEIRIPKAGRFRLLARLPEGLNRQENLLVAILTDDPLPLDGDLLATENVFALFDNGTATRSIVRLQQDAGVYSAGRTVVTVAK